MANHESSILDLLRADHETVRAKLEELAETTTRAVKKRASLLEEIAAELRAHAQAEEKVFYAALRKAAESKEHETMLAEAREEHRAVEKLVLPDLEKTGPGSVEFSGRAKVLEELVGHHADEEEDELFETAKQLLSKDELRELGARFRQEKEALLEKASS